MQSSCHWIDPLFHREMGVEVDEVMAATSRLAEAQCMRQATSLQALPFVHWALLYIIAVGVPDTPSNPTPCLPMSRQLSRQNDRGRRRAETVADCC